MATGLDSNTLYYLMVFGMGSIVMRGAGCTVNDMWDARFDRLVERTKDRPLAAKTISYTQATLFLGAQLSLGLCILTQLNMASILLGASSLVLVSLYPLMKRVTHWPQAVLGLVFNWGALLGWTALLGYLPDAAFPLYIGGVFWTLVYDTIYALQDTKDDVKVGVKSTALFLTSRGILKPALSLFAGISVLGFATAGILNGQGIPYFLVSVVGPMIHFGWQISTLDPTSVKDAALKFASNRNLGLLVLAGILLDQVLSF